jgi:hypothetical protein
MFAAILKGEGNPCHDPKTGKFAPLASCGMSRHDIAHSLGDKIHLDLQDSNRELHPLERLLIKQVESVASTLGYPLELIHVTDKGYTFDLNGETHDAAGVAYTHDTPRKGEIDIYLPITVKDFMSEYSSGDQWRRINAEQNLISDVNSIVSHEIMHHMFRATFEAFEREERKAMDDYQSAWSDWEHEGGRRRGEPMPVRANPMMDYKTGKWPKMDKKYKDKYPHLYNFHNFMFAKFDRLKKEDGITAYSSKWWQAYNDYVSRKTTTYIDFLSPVTETLAEYAARRSRLSTPERSSWTDLFKFVKSSWMDKSIREAYLAGQIAYYEAHKQ